MEEEAIAEVDIEVVDFEQRELDHDVAFALQKSQLFCTHFATGSL